MGTTAIIRINVIFKDGKEKDRVSNLIKEKEDFEEVPTKGKNNLIGDIYREVGFYTNLDKVLDDIEAYFDKSKVEEGYLDLYLYNSTRYLHEG